MPSRRKNHKLRILEGEPVEYRGRIWIIKGEQHPRGYLVAYPRYDLVLKDRIKCHEAYRLISQYTRFWSCLKQEVPLIPIDEVKPYTQIHSHKALTVKKIIEEITGSYGEVLVTGSSLIMEGNDVDIIIYTDEPVTVIERIRNHMNSLVEEMSIGGLLREWMLKHKELLDFNDYLYLKQNSLLHIRVAGVPVSLRIVPYTNGFQGCIDPVYDRREYNGLVEVLSPITRYTSPARYHARLATGDHVILETRRILYAEISPGRYWMEKGYLEKRMTGYYIVPDHGRMKPMMK